MNIQTKSVTYRTAKVNYKGGTYQWSKKELGTIKDESRDNLKSECTIYRNMLRSLCNAL